MEVRVVWYRGSAMRHVAVLLLLPLAVPAQTAKPEEFSTVQGRVINAVTGDPVGKASLRLIRTDATGTSENWTRSYTASSDSTGNFAIRNIDPGKYRLRASRNGFVTLEYGARGSKRFGTVLDLDSAQQLKGADLRLTPCSVIMGRVVDAEGEPLERAQVQLLRHQYVNGKKGLSTTATRYTNDLGDYRLYGLDPGRYYIYVENFSEQLAPASVAAESYVPMYYPGAAEAAGAVPIDVGAGAQVVAADMMLRKARTATVKGRVVVTLPGAADIPEVTATPRAGHNNRAATEWHSSPAKVNATGQFEIPNLTPGSYWVGAAVVMGRLWHTSPSTMVDVAGADIEGIVLSIGPGLSIAGRIRVDGKTTQGGFQNANIKLRRGGPTADFSDHGSTRIAKDGAFKEDGLDPGVYGILVGGLPDGFYTKSIRVGDAEVMYSGIDLTSGASGPVEILVSPSAGLVSGVAQNRKTGKPAANATVVLVPQEKERLEIFAFYQQATTDQSGRFKLKSVAPGEYKVYAWEDVQSTAWMDSDFMKQFEGKGESVTVREATQVNVQVNLIPADSEDNPHSGNEPAPL